jgi:5-methylcytosine-specific restriction enzyme subunit McrC
MDIPVKNLYYLLCYAWNKLEEKEKVKVLASDYEEAAELFARVLVNGCTHLFKRGLDRCYNEVVQEYSGVKGKIVFSESLNKNSFERGKAFCRFDQFEYNVIHNQIIKATLLRMAKVKNLDAKLRHEVWAYYWKFDEVDDIELHLHHFSKVRIHRNNSFYDFILRICKLILESTVLSEDKGSYYFRKFTGNDRAMASLFEAFVRNFYKKEQKEYRVRREDIRWAAQPLAGSDRELLPKMQTDVTLESSVKKIVMDAKYYKDTLAINYDAEKIHSGNLYQLYAYLRNLEADSTDKLNSNCEGILLYPTVQRELNQSYQIGNHTVRIATVDLAKDWRDIHSRLKKIICVQ